MVPPQLTSRLGFINPGLTLLAMRHFGHGGFLSHGGFPHVLIQNSVVSDSGKTNAIRGTRILGPPYGAWNIIYHLDI